MPKLMTPAMEAIQVREKKKPRKSGPWWDAWYILRHNKAAIVGMVIMAVLVLFALFPDQIAPYGEDEQIYTDKFQFPNWEHPLGTDNFGRDILSRIIYGSRVSLQIGVVSVSMSLVFGGLLGMLAAYYSGKTDNVIMRFMDILMAMPSFLLAMAIAAALGTGLFNMMLAISVSSAPNFARIVRAAALTVKEQEYIEAARAIGSGSSRLMFRHMLPNCIAPIIVQATLGVAGAILSAAGLSFLGLGVQPPTAEWGYMLNAGRQYIRTYWHIVTFPGVTIMITIFALNLLGDGLRDALDPKLKR